jgi:hypothetical protein
LIECDGAVFGRIGEFEYVAVRTGLDEKVLIALAAHRLQGSGYSELPNQKSDRFVTIDGRWMHGQGRAEMGQNRHDGKPQRKS